MFGSTQLPEERGRSGPGVRVAAAARAARPSPGVIKAIAGFAGSVALVLYFIREAHAGVYNDLGIYLQASRMIAHGTDPYANLVTQLRVFHHGSRLPLPAYVYAPIFAILLTPLAYLPLSVAGFIWSACKLVFLSGIAFFLLRSARKPSPIWLVVCLAFAIMLLNPSRFDFETGQADIFVVFLLSASFLAARSDRPILCGLLLASAAAIKTPLLALVVFYAWKSQWRIVASSTVSWIALVFLPFAILGRAALHNQMFVWSFWSNQFTSFAENSSIKGVLSRIFSHNLYGPGLINSPTLVTVLWISIGLLFGLAAIALISREAVHKTPLSLAEFSLAVCSLLLLSPLTEATHLVLLAVPLLLSGSAILPRVTSGHSRGLAVAVIAVYAALCTPVHRISVSPLLYSYIGHGGVRGALAVLAAAVYLYLTLFAYAVCVVWLLREKGWWLVSMSPSLLTRAASVTARALIVLPGSRRVASHPRGD